ncbi:MAG: glycosyltransferase family 2 protein, partial [Lachnospiraceae bacterium]|nr:glycosyltransferase family 2 protein [Lachnospiraceae bacterium]
MKQPLISIIIPVYNIEEYLPRCIESVLGQTYANIEVILVDDGSKDKSGEICDSYQKRDSRVRVIHKENGGSSSARNAGIADAKGEFIGFVDSDDYVETTMYETMMQAIESTGCAIVQVARDEIDANGKQMPNVCEMPKEQTEYSAEEFLKELLLHKGDCSFCTKILKRDLFSGNRFPEGVLKEDFHLLVNLLRQGEKIISLPYCGYHVFYRIGSNTRKKDKNAFSR